MNESLYSTPFSREIRIPTISIRLFLSTDINNKTLIKSYYPETLNYQVINMEYRILVYLNLQSLQLKRQQFN